MNTKLDALKKKQAELKAQIQTLASAERSRERKRETRRKILVGAYFLERAREKNTFDQLVQRMVGYLQRQSDRVLFDLPPLESSERAVTSEASASKPEAIETDVV